MSGSFRPDEMVQVQGRSFAVVGGRLRVAHERHRDRLSIRSQVIEHVLDSHAVVRVRVVTSVGVFTATATASASRDPKLADSLVELAETRAVARALRFAGIGPESCGLEELGAGLCLEGTAPTQPIGSVPGGVGVAVIGGNGSRARAGTPMSTAQRRCIDTLSRRVHQDPSALVTRFLPGAELDELTMMEASKVIDQLKRGSNGSNGGGHPGGGGTR